MDINVVHAELGHASEVITKANGRAIELNLRGTCKTCEGCIFGKVEKSLVSKKAVEHSKFWEKGCYLISAHFDSHFWR